MRIAWGLCLVALLALLGTAAAGIYPARGRVHRVDVVSFEFQPRALTIDAGDRVEWSFRVAGHSVGGRERPVGVRRAGRGRFVYATIRDSRRFRGHSRRPHDFMQGTIAVRPRSAWRAVWFWSLALAAAAAAAAALRAPSREMKLSTLGRTPNICSR